MQTRCVSEIIEVEEIFDVIDAGVTAPVKCRLKNGKIVVVKYMQNRCGTQVLVNEWIGSNIADIMELTIPEYGICSLSEEVIENTNENEELDINNSGFCFYTKYYPKAIPVNSMAMLPLVSNKDTEKIILFDCLVNNHDRHTGNLFYDISKGLTLLAIDNSHIITYEPIFPFHFESQIDTSEIISNRVIKQNEDIYSMLIHAMGFSEERLRNCADQVKDNITEETVDKIFNSIPSSWIESIGVKKINQLSQIIKKKLSYIDDITKMILEERRRL